VLKRNKNPTGAIHLIIIRILPNKNSPLCPQHNNEPSPYVNKNKELCPLFKDNTDQSTNINTIKNGINGGGGAEHF